MQLNSGDKEIEPNEEKKFMKFMNWVKNNRRKAERFNNRIKKAVIQEEFQNDEK